MDNFCVLPFVSIEADPMGKCKVCCLSYETIPDIDLKKNTLTEAFNSSYMVKLRQSFLNGEKPSNCNRCWDEEAAGRKSKRQHTLDKMKHVDISESKLVFLDLKLGNICNLKCRICGSFSSSKWAQEEIDIYPDNKTARQNLIDGRWPREAEAFWTDLTELLANTKYFEFTGGEPFLIDEHFTLLEIAVEMGYASEIEIHYNTNTTALPKRGLELWPHFKRVEIALSIDDLGPRFEYQRYGANWQTALANLQKFRELRDNNSNITLQLCITLNVFNIWNMNDMCHWIAQQKFDFVYFNVLHSAPQYSIKNLSDSAKQIVTGMYSDYNGEYAEDVRHLVEFMNLGSGSNMSQLLCSVKQSDDQRRQHLKDYIPELARVLNYE
jgi:MoaA/NifB/PqqE/SkfB family radical SAM enzyme